MKVFLLCQPVCTSPLDSKLHEGHLPCQLNDPSYTLFCALVPKLKKGATWYSHFLSKKYIVCPFLSLQKSTTLFWGKKWPKKKINQWQCKERVIAIFMCKKYFPTSFILGLNKANFPMWDVMIRYGYSILSNSSTITRSHHPFSTVHAEVAYETHNSIVKILRIARIYVRQALVVTCDGWI